MLLVTAIIILTGPNYIDRSIRVYQFFNLDHNRNIKQILRGSYLFLASRYLIFKPN